MFRGITLADEPLHALHYASPTTPRQHLRHNSRYVAYAAGTFAVFAAIFIPDTFGSGVVRVNPFAALACFAVMGGAIVYIWMRLFEENGRFTASSAFLGVCATIAIIALPFQFWILAHSYGGSRPWLQLKLYSPTLLRPNLYWPGLIVICALFLAAVSRGITRFRSRPGRRRGPSNSKKAT